MDSLNGTSSHIGAAVRDARKTPERSTRPARILVVDDKPYLASRISGLFPGKKVEVIFERSVQRVLERFESAQYDVLIFSGWALAWEDGDGMDILEVISAQSPGTHILALVDPARIKLAISAMRLGSCQYARLPLGDEELQLLIQMALDQRPDHAPNMLLRPQGKTTGFENMIGQSQAMQAVFRQIRQAAATDIPVLLDGETGTGKDLAAWCIHLLSSRSSQPYLPVHLGALPQEMVASELFGHEKGAFTGALARRPGTFEQADKGTVFLDEVSSMDEKTQVSLLRLLETSSFSRLGGRKPLSSDVRIIAATNENLFDAIKKGVFREDLYYRLDVFRIIMPPISQRHGDISLLIDHFLKRFNDEMDKNIRGISTDCLTLMESYPWPGNVRELRNVIQRAVVVCGQDVLLPEHLPTRITSRKQGGDRMVHLKVGATLQEMEKEMIIRTLLFTGKNRQKAASMLGISRRALYNKMARHNITL